MKPNEGQSNKYFLLCLFARQFSCKCFVVWKKLQKFSNVETLPTNSSNQPSKHRNLSPRNKKLKYQCVLYHNWLNKPDNLKEMWKLLLYSLETNDQKMSMREKCILGPKNVKASQLCPKQWNIFWCDIQICVKCCLGPNEKEKVKISIHQHFMKWLFRSDIRTTVTWVMVVMNMLIRIT